MTYESVVDFYVDAYSYVSTHGFKDEILWCDRRPPLEEHDAVTFLWEYVWVVMNAGMREQVARTIYERVVRTHDPNVIGHPGKRSAVKRAFQEYESWFAALLAADDPTTYLETLPWIGPITKYHLARNLGVDCVKPDRHLARLAERFGYGTPDAMCRAIQDELGGRLGTIDAVLWRYCNLRGTGSASWH